MNIVFSFSSGHFNSPRESKDNAYEIFLDHKQRALWYVMIFSGVVNCLQVYDPVFSLAGAGILTLPRKFQIQFFCLPAKSLHLVS